MGRKVTERLFLKFETSEGRSYEGELVEPSLHISPKSLREGYRSEISGVVRSSDEPTYDGPGALTVKWVIGDHREESVTVPADWLTVESGTTRATRKFSIFLNAEEIRSILL